MYYCDGFSFSYFVLSWLFLLQYSTISNLYFVIWCYGLIWCCELVKVLLFHCSTITFFTSIFTISRSRSRVWDGILSSISQQHDQDIVPLFSMFIIMTDETNTKFWLDIGVLVNHLWFVSIDCLCFHLTKMIWLKISKFCKIRVLLGFVVIGRCMELLALAFGLPCGGGYAYVCCWQGAIGVGCFRELLRLVRMHIDNIMLLVGDICTRLNRYLPIKFTFFRGLPFSNFLLVWIWIKKRIWCGVYSLSYLC